MAVSLPPDFIRMMQEQYGSDAACALCHALLETEPEVSVRINPRKRPQTPEGEALTLQT